MPDFRIQLLDASQPVRDELSDILIEVVANGGSVNRLRMGTLDRRTNGTPLWSATVSA